MPVFDTPAPISVILELGVGDVRVVASDRADTVVEVRPSDGTKPSDVSAAEQTHVEYTGGRLLVKGPQGMDAGWKRFSFGGSSESVDVTIEMPEGSNVQVDAGVAALRCEGRLGECRFKTGVGDMTCRSGRHGQAKDGGR